ncbi:hypothetical protein SLS55_002780 [Diplodia seriata]|uniref:DUF7730 domain-containing protein n=1 Tax=Diplodia seriata TaxID=420778 RepID=A0ABR3CL58_9PEZI
MATTEWTECGLSSLADAVDAFAIRDIQHTPAPAHPPPSPLLRLPRELRDQIYRHVLVEPPYWHKLHQPSCHLNRNREARGTTPTPSTLIAPPGKRFADRRAATSCACAKRDLALRLACRQLYVETASVFYGGGGGGGNAFFLRDPLAAVRWMRRLPPAARGLVRRLCVLHRGTTMPLAVRKAALARQLQPLLLTLTGLRELYIDDHVLACKYIYRDHFAGGAPVARDALPPGLRSLRVVHVDVWHHHHHAQRSTACPVWQLRDVPLDGEYLWRDAADIGWACSFDMRGPLRRFLRARGGGVARRPAAEAEAEAEAVPCEWDGVPVRVKLDRRTLGWDEAWVFGLPVAEGGTW